MKTLVIALNPILSDKVQNYVTGLLESGTELEIVIRSPRSWPPNDTYNWADLIAHPGARVHELHRPGTRQFLPRTERWLVHRLPGVPLMWLRKTIGRIPPLRKPMARMQRLHARLALRTKRKIFDKVYRTIIEPLSLARMFRRRDQGINFASVERIVAADIYGLSLGWQLARRHPGIPATRSLTDD